MAGPFEPLSPPHPLYRLILFGLAWLSLALAVLPPLFVNRGVSWERRLYWGGFLAAGVFIALGCLPNWEVGVAFALLDLALATGTAYLNGPGIKIRGKVYALYLEDSRTKQGRAGGDGPDHDPVPSYGGLTTPRKAWWMNVFAFAFGVFLLVATIHAPGAPWFMYVGTAAALVIFPSGIGYAEASLGCSVARGQRVQFAIIAVITLGVVNIVYLLGYAAGRRWPLRRTRSMDYGAHARHPRVDGD